MTEIWKPVVGWENLYEVSNLGNIRTLHYKKPYLMHPTVDQKGYMRISFVAPNTKKYKRYGVHRVVAEAFIPNPEKLPQINHKDEDKTNNHIDNLEWCTGKYNCNYGKHNDKIRASRVGMKLSNSHIANLRKVRTEIAGKAVIQLSQNGDVINRFNSISEASRCTGVSISSISHTCNGRSKMGCGYVWEFTNDDK